MRYLPTALLVASLGLACTAQAQTLVATSNILVRALDRSLDFKIGRASCRERVASPV